MAPKKPIKKKPTVKKPVNKPPVKRGRPSEASVDIFKEICARVSDGEDIIKILKSDDRFPCWGTFCNWKRNDKELSALYAHAREDKAETFEHKINSVINNLQQGLIDSNSAKVVIDTLKWQASKSSPKQYGDSIKLSGDKDNPIQIEQITGMKID